MVLKVRDLFADKDDDGYMMIDFNQFLPSDVQFYRCDGYIIYPTPGQVGPPRPVSEILEEPQSQRHHDSVGFIIMVSRLCLGDNLVI